MRRRDGSPLGFEYFNPPARWRRAGPVPAQTSNGAETGMNSGHTGDMKTVTNPTTKIIRWIREILLPLAILVGFSATVHFVRLAWAITTHAASEQTAPVAIEAERHHVLLLQNNHVRVFALTLPPGAQSLVQHEHNYVTIQMEEH